MVDGNSARVGELPLRGIRVLELSHIIAGPSAGLLLADLGAEVLRVEDPRRGDPFRTSNPAMFAFFNRNKRAIAVDLKTKRGHEIALRLAADADVVIDNFAPGVVQRLGLDYEALSRVNPKIICLSIKGFLPGPSGNRPLLDELAQMMGGLAYMTGPTGHPLRAGASVVDMGAAAYGVIAVLAAIIDREVTGRGQNITSGLFETVVFWVGQHMAEAAAAGEPVVPFPERAQGDRMGWGVYNLFATSDHRQVFIGITSDAHWARFCRAFGLNDLASDERLSANLDRAMARDWLIPALADVLRNYPAAEILEKLAAAEVPFAPVNRPDELFEDPQLNKSGQLLAIPVTEDVQAKLPAPPFVSDEYRIALRQSAPALGEHTRETLLEIGYSADEIDRLAADHVLRIDSRPT